MSQKSATLIPKPPAERVVRDIRRATPGTTRRTTRSASCWRGCAARTVSPPCAGARALPRGLYYAWSKEFLEAGKRRLAGDTARAATTDEIKDLRLKAPILKEVVAEQALELRLLKKSMIADGDDRT